LRGRSGPHAFRQKLGKLGKRELGVSGQHKKGGKKNFFGNKEGASGEFQRPGIDHGQWRKGGGGIQKRNPKDQGAIYGGPSFRVTKEGYRDVSHKH